jgi:pimeloyl-ACP methyl ester carboxylesterase
MKNVYVFSGLGVDERVFKNIKFSGYNPAFIKWVSPFSGETIQHYSKRLLTQIKDSHPILVGLSFGGIVAIEVSKLIATEKVILIASAKIKAEIPFYFRLSGLFKLHKIIPPGFLKHSNLFTYWLFGAGKHDRSLLLEILSDTDPFFLKWAIDKIVHWQNEHYPINISHIHGSADRILPVKFVKPDFKIKNGGHFMTVNKPEEINDLLKNLL